MDIDFDKLLAEAKTLQEKMAVLQLKRLFYNIDAAVDSANKDRALSTPAQVYTEMFVQLAPNYCKPSGATPSQLDADRDAAFLRMATEAAFKEYRDGLRQFSA